MARLRVQPDVVAVAGHIHVEILEQLLHLRDEHVATPLSLHPVERFRKATARPAVEDIHPARVARIVGASAAAARRVRSCAASRECDGVRATATAPTSAATTTTTAAGRFGNAGNVDTHLLR